ncbi:hypothetical protein [Micromonospora sp. NPDC005174]|uniref:hypothetical protein n=1 Tax=Micromonospora sp. NPDC005174 TaxID=3157018 RepID=UPI0033A51E7B
MTASRTFTTSAITWRCHQCDLPARAGVLHINHQQVHAAEQAAKAWDADHPADEAFNVADVLMMPHLAQWQVSCDGCLSSHDCGGCYEISLSQVSTFTALLRWQAHLYDKSWFDATNWVAFVHRLAQEHAPHESAGAW